MPAIATSKFRVHNAEQFLEAFSEAAPTNMYFYIGGVSPFVDDNNPPTPTNDTDSIEFVPWRDSIAAKRVKTDDVIQVIDRYNWTSGVVYDYYDDKDTNLLDDDFYVITEDYNVYKCLWNAGGVGSTVKPDLTTTAPFTTGDGYLWKYMYTITTAEALKFLTNDFMPVRTDTTVGAAAIDGGLHVIKVTNGGSGYTTATVAVDGDGTGVTASATLNAGAVESITISPGDEGSGYTFANVTISGDGTNATVQAVISPRGGHGSNAPEELGGKFVMMNIRLDGNEGGAVSTENDFRKVGLIRDPIDDDTSIVATGDVYRQTYRYTLGTLGGTGTFAQDETVTVGDSSAEVIEWDSVNNYLYTSIPLPDVADFTTSATLTSSGGGTGQITTIDAPGLRAYTGDVLYIENRSPISRATDQIEDVKLIIEF